MQWTKDPKVGDVRIVAKFALFPTYVGNTVVWLEDYYVEEECITSHWLQTIWMEIRRFVK
jgi:hypothetical protein